MVFFLIFMKNRSGGISQNLNSPDILRDSPLHRQAYFPTTSKCRYLYLQPPTPGCSNPAIKGKPIPYPIIIFANKTEHTTSYDAEDAAVLRNIDACRTIASTVQTSLGPFGRNKIIINHLQKMVLTSDAATILRELEVVHPAAKLLVMAAQQQEAEMGDATNFVIVFAGELLKKAEELLRMGLKTADVVAGYEKGCEVAVKELAELSIDRVDDVRNKDELSKALRTVISAKQAGSEDVLAELVAEAVLAVLPKIPANFNVDNVRVVKILGGSLEQSRVVKGMVFNREPEGTVKKAAKAKV